MVAESEEQRLAVYCCVNVIVKSLEPLGDGLYKVRGLDAYFTALDKGLLEEYLAAGYTCPICGVKAGRIAEGGECPVCIEMFENNIEV
jgi:hypothetical protein